MSHLNTNLISAHVYRVFSNNGIQGNIPYRWLYALLLLQLIGITHEAGAFPAAPIEAPCKATVIVTTAHAHTISFCIERHQRHEHKIQGPGLHQSLWLPSRFSNTITVGIKRISRLPAREPKAFLTYRMQHRQIALFAHSTGPFQNRQWIEFTICSEIERHTLGALEAVHGAQLFAGCLGRSPATGRIQLTPPGAYLLSDRVGKDHEEKTSSACAATDLRP